MLVTFRTKAYPDITMFGDVAIKLLKLMGLSGTVPSAIEPADVATALERLQAAIAAQKTLEKQNQPAEAHDREAEPVVKLSQRALPLLDLLRAAAQKRAAVMWDS